MRKERKMAKKSFIGQGNPAMQFISGAEENRSAGDSTGENAKTTSGKRSPGKGERSHDKQGKQGTSDKPAAAPVSEQSETVRRPVAPRRQGESKSKRVQLLMPPSLHMRVARKAASLDMSVNEYVNRILEESLG